MSSGPSVAADAVTALRAGAAVHDVDTPTQQRFERWARREHWRLREEALPLLVGFEPSDWRAHLEATGTSAIADALLDTLARDLGVDPSASVAPLAIGDWARSHGVRVPLALERLLDFISGVLPPAADDRRKPQDDVLRAQEREILLGAALLLVTKEPAACVDEDGYYSPPQIARLILARARLWFPLAPPTLDEAAIATLIGRWIRSPRVEF